MFCIIIVTIIIILIESIPNTSVIIHWQCGQDLFMWLMAVGGAIG